MSIAAHQGECEEKIWTVVHQVFQDALELDPEEVTFSSKVISELDAESIDFLDIAFHLEKSFQKKTTKNITYLGNLTLHL